MKKTIAQQLLLALILLPSSLINCQLLSANDTQTRSLDYNAANSSNSSQASTLLVEEKLHEPDLELQLIQSIRPSYSELIQFLEVMAQKIDSLEQENQELKLQLNTLQDRIAESDVLNSSALARNKKLEESILEENQNFEQELKKLRVTVSDFTARNNTILAIALASGIGAILLLAALTLAIAHFRKKANSKKLHAIEADYDKKIDELSNRLNLLIQSLQIEKDSPDPKAVRITGALSYPQIIRVNLSSTKLVEIYNDCPQVLSSNAIKVSVRADSYRQKTQGQIFLEREGRGNYWIIAITNEEYWLLPNTNISLNIHKLKTVQFLFECVGEYLASDGEFTLEQPAKVEILPSGHEWILKEQGKLVFKQSEVKIL